MDCQEARKILIQYHTGNSDSDRVQVDQAITHSKCCLTCAKKAGILLKDVTLAGEGNISCQMFTDYLGKHLQGTVLGNRVKVTNNKLLRHLVSCSSCFGQYKLLQDIEKTRTDDKVVELLDYPQFNLSFLNEQKDKRGKREVKTVRRNLRMPLMIAASNAVFVAALLFICFAPVIQKSYSVQESYTVAEPREQTITWNGRIAANREQWIPLLDIDTKNKDPGVVTVVITRIPIDDKRYSPPGPSDKMLFYPVPLPPPPLSARSQYSIESPTKTVIIGHGEGQASFVPEAPGKYLMRYSNTGTDSLEVTVNVTRNYQETDIIKYRTASKQKRVSILEILLNREPK